MTGKDKTTFHSDEVEHTGIASSLNLVALEEIILVALGAVRALQTTNQEYGHANSDKDGEDIRVSLEPVHQSSHKGSAFSQRAPSVASTPALKTSRGYSLDVIHPCSS